MHLIGRKSGVIEDNREPVDLGQEPGDIIVLSAADSELSVLARAHDRLGSDRPSLRLANLMQLSHNMSVDMYLERTVRQSKLVVLRLLGGRSYWPYGLEQLVAAARQHRIKLAVLPGDATPDPALMQESTVGLDACARLWRYLVEGGIENAQSFLGYGAHLLGRTEAPPAPRPLLKCGLYWPGETAPSLAVLEHHWRRGAPVAAILFYRALYQSGNTEPVDRLIEALAAQRLNALPVFVTSLKDPIAASTIEALFAQAAPAAILNATGFAIASASGDGDRSPLAGPDSPILQVVFSGSSREQWAASTQGLSPRDLAMNVVLPELDGRIMAGAVSFKSDAEIHDATQCRIVTYRADPGRVGFVARLAAAWVRLRLTPAAERRVAIILANYPNRDGRIGNGVGYDTPASTIKLLTALRDRGYALTGHPGDGNALIEMLLQGPTNRGGAERDSHATLPLDTYQAHYRALPEAVRQEVEARWGQPTDDPFFRAGAFRLAVRRFGNVAVAIQPARGYNLDPKATYHDPALVPPHGYFAFHIWLREVFAAQAVVHNGKHGNLEWLPGKAVALSDACYPEAALGPVPNIYPFIVNDPGEGTQAKRRCSAVIIDHLTPPLARAESYGPLEDLEALIDEYYLASGLDARRLALLRERILDLSRSSGLDIDSGIAALQDKDAALRRLDTYLCDLKEAMIRDGLHVLGEAPEGRQETSLLVALTRVPRRRGEGGDQSLIRALALDLGLDGFDPLAAVLGEAWTGPRPVALLTLDRDTPWRTKGDTVERLERLAEAVIAGAVAPDPAWTNAALVLDEIARTIRPLLRASGAGEIAAALAALDGRFVPPGPSGAPTRGRIDVLPTGRNFYSVDNRAVPTPAAWLLGRKSAELLLERHFQDHGAYLRSIGLSVWGTSNMRTGGDDIAQALALIGVQPVWERACWRVTGFEIIPLKELGRPRVDVTLRISGFFRDAFPAQIALFDDAVRAVGARAENERENPIAAHMRSEVRALERDGLDADSAQRVAGFRVFGSKPGAYGAGLQALIDEKIWDRRADFAGAYIEWGAYAYGAGENGRPSEMAFTRRLRRIEAVVQNQDNREHDLLDSDDYYQFEGGMTAAVEHVSGTRPAVYHNDHSRPERPVIRSLEEEIGRVVRSRVVNPKWIAGMMRHGYKGAFEIAATVDYMFAFAATTGAVRDHHFQLAYDAFVGDETVRDFLAKNNAPGFAEIAERFREAIDRGLWTPRSNSAYHELSGLAAGSRIGPQVAL